MVIGFRIGMEKIYILSYVLFFRVGLSYWEIRKDE